MGTELFEGNLLATQSIRHGREADAPTTHASIYASPSDGGGFAFVEIDQAFVSMIVEPTLIKLWERVVAKHEAEGALSKWFLLSLFTDAGTPANEIQ